MNKKEEKLFSQDCPYLWDSRNGCDFSEAVMYFYNRGNCCKDRHGKCDFYNIEETGILTWGN